MSVPAPKREHAAMTDTLELPPPGEATYADLEALPERYVGEIIAGTLYAQARPASPHAQAAAALFGALQVAFGRRTGNDGGDRPGGWCLLFEPELHFGADVLVPDIAGWRRGRMPEIPDVPWFELAPDWICEVSSPSTRRLDRSLKLERYRRAGVGHVWLVEAQDRFIEVYRHAEPGWLLIGTFVGDAEARIEPFEVVPLLLEELWLRSSPPAPG
jgi:Uma2 family endonuclease